jgi:hypothetical protein
MYSHQKYSSRMKIKIFLGKEKLKEFLLPTLSLKELIEEFLQVLD